MSQGEPEKKENVRKLYIGKRNTTCTSRLLNEYAGFAVIRAGKMNKKENWIAEKRIFVCGCSWRSFKMQNLVDDTEISSPCHSLCVHFVNTQIIEKHFCDDAAVLNIPCNIEIVKLHRKILIETANIYLNIDTCTTMVHVECMLRHTGKLFSCSCTSSCNNLNKQTHKKLQQLITMDYESKSAYF